MEGIVEGLLYVQGDIGITIGQIMDILEIVFIFTILVLVTAFLIDSSFNPFLYFRF